LYAFRIAVVGNPNSYFIDSIRRSIEKRGIVNKPVSLEVIKQKTGDLHPGERALKSVIDDWKSQVLNEHGKVIRAVTICATYPS
jgi:hypothetical protein